MKELLLDVRRKEEQVHDLRDAGAGARGLLEGVGVDDRLVLALVDLPLVVDLGGGLGHVKPTDAERLGAKDNRTCKNRIVLNACGRPARSSEAGRGSARPSGSAVEPFGGRAAASRHPAASACVCG